MNFYEWELTYLEKLLSNKEKAVNKSKDKGENFYARYRLEREREALRTIIKIVGREAEHLNEAMKG